MKQEEDNVFPGKEESVLEMLSPQSILIAHVCISHEALQKALIGAPPHFSHI